MKLLTAKRLHCGPDTALNRVVTTAATLAEQALLLLQASVVQLAALRLRPVADQLVALPQLQADANSWADANFSAVESFVDCLAEADASADMVAEVAVADATRADLAIHLTVEAAAVVATLAALETHSLEVTAADSAA